MQKCLLALVIVLALPISTAPALDCGSASDQRSMNRCTAMALEQADGELNRLYGLIGQRLGGDAGTKKLLVSAQRGWIAFRDAECKFSTSAVTGGSVYPAVYSGCMERLTRQRIADFTAYLNCQEGDLGCPVPAN